MNTCETQRDCWAMRDLWTLQAEENQALVWPCSVWYHSGQWACFWPCLLTVPWNAPLEQCKLHWNRPDTVRQQCSLCVELSRLAYSWCSSLSSELQLWANKSKLQHCVCCYAVFLHMLECMAITGFAMSFMQIKHEQQLNGSRELWCQLLLFKQYITYYIRIRDHGEL